MDNLTDKLTELLGDPGSMKQIMDMASSLSGQLGQETEVPPNLPEQVQQLMTEAPKATAKEDALVRALLPYLRPNRKARLQRAMQVAHLSQIASAAWKSSVANRPSEEDNHV